MRLSQYAIGSVADSSDVFAGVHAKLERQSAGPSAQQNPAVDLVERPRENRARHAALSTESLRISHAARVERQARAEMNRTNTLSRVAIGPAAEKTSQTRTRRHWMRARELLPTASRLRATPA